MAASAPSSLLTIVACGSQGIDELRQSVTASGDERPYFALVRVPIGQGIKKAKVASKKVDAKRICGETNGEVMATEISQLETVAFLETLAKQGISISSDPGASVNIKAMKADYEAALAPAGSKAATKAKVDLKSGKGRKTAADLKVSTNAALKAVREETGAFNWALFQPTDKEPLQLENAGSLSVPECRRFLKDDAALFGILRLSFGQPESKFRRTKHVFVSFCGTKAPIAKRARFQGCKAFMKSALGHTSLDIQLNNAADFDVGHIIATIKASMSVEGDAHTVEDTYNEQAFMSALAEEAKAAGTFFGDDGDLGEAEKGPAAPPLPTTTEAIDGIRKGEAMNWALFTVNI